MEINSFLCFRYCRMTPMQKFISIYCNNKLYRFNILTLSLIFAYTVDMITIIYWNISSKPSNIYLIIGLVGPLQPSSKTNNWQSTFRYVPFICMAFMYSKINAANMWTSLISLTCFHFEFSIYHAAYIYFISVLTLGVNSDSQCCDEWTNSYLLVHNYH